MLRLIILSRLLIFVALLAFVCADGIPWPNRVCYYEIRAGAPEEFKRKFRKAADIIEKNSCVRFVEKTTKNDVISV